jgi:uncharacterized protein (TIGR03435 family)
MMLTVPAMASEPYVGAPGDRFSDGWFRYTNVPLRLLIRQAFERPGSDAVRGGPGWLDTDRWDFDAKAESATADMLPMIRKLLTERFRLRHHIESEEGPVYELTFARRDRRLGSSLRQARGSRSFRGGSGSITGRALSILDLARLLSTGAGRPVLDRTGLSATYDVDLRWAPASPAGQAPSDLPDFFTAIQEQLWLRLHRRAARGPMVIDSAERPSGTRLRTVDGGSTIDGSSTVGGAGSSAAGQGPKATAFLAEPPTTNCHRPDSSHQLITTAASVRQAFSRATRRASSTDPSWIVVMSPIRVQHDGLQHAPHDLAAASLGQHRHEVDPPMTARAPSFRTTASSPFAHVIKNCKKDDLAPHCPPSHHALGHGRMRDDGALHLDVSGARQS